MLCQEEFHPFQILFIPGIYCHLLDQELLSFPLLSSPINQIYYFMFIFFLFTSGVFWKSIHFEVASDSFSLLINSSWLLVFAIILFVLIFPYILTLHVFFSYHFWCRDLLRELDKKYEVLLIIFFLLFGGVLVSEALLFVSFFWTSFHSLSSITLGIISHEAFYLPDPCELTFANTLLLSNAAISLGITFTSLEISSLFYISLSFTLCSLFISLQGKEFRILALLINDSLYSCLFFTITGLHFFHLVYGLLLLSLLFWSCSFSYSHALGIQLDYFYCPRHYLVQLQK